MSTYAVEIMQYGNDGSSLILPAPQEMQQVLGRTFVQRGERLVKQDDISLLQEQTRKQSPLELTDGKFGDLSVRNGSEADGSQRLENILGNAWRRLADGTKVPPTAECNEFGDRDRKPAIEFVLLWQIGQAMTRNSRANDLTGRRPNNPGKRFQERTLPGPVWADNGGEARGQELAGQTLKRASFAIAYGKIADRDTSLSLMGATV
jgi:hypothetical protein